MNSRRYRFAARTACSAECCTTDLRQIEMSGVWPIRRDRLRLTARISAAAAAAAITLLYAE